MQWLCTRGIRIPAVRRVRSLATRVVCRAECALATTIGAAERPFIEGVRRTMIARARAATRLIRRQLEKMTSNLPPSSN